MARMIILCLSVALLSATVGAQLTGDFFNCNREGQTCSTGTTCAADGSCTCGADDVHANPGSAFDHKCFTQNYITSKLDQAPCVAGECNEGLCMGGVSPYCFCKSAYIGSVCDQPRFDASCDAYNMHVAFTPYTAESAGAVEGSVDESSFDGRMFAQDHDEDACRLLNVSGSYERDFTLGTGCGMKMETLVDGSVRFSLPIVVVYTSSSPAVITGTDQLLTAQCTFSPNATVTFQNIVDMLDRGGNNATGLLVDALTLSIRNAAVPTTTYTMDTAPVPVGTDLIVQIDFVPNIVFKNFKVVSGWVGNMENMADPKFVSLPFVTDGCPGDQRVATGAHVVTQVPAGGPPHTLITLKMPSEALLFVAGANGNLNTLYYELQLDLCNDDNAAACAASTCGGPARKKRAVREQVVTTTLGGSVTVIFGEEDNTLTTNNQTTTENPSDRLEVCMQQPQAQNIVIMLGAFLLLLLIAAITLAILYCRRRRGNRKGEDMSSDGSSNPGYASSAYDLTSRAR